MWQDTGGFNTFYIFHEETINGTTSKYLSVFLHSNSLETSLRTDINANGHAEVTRGQHIAYVGNVGAGGANHIHLEFYKKNGSDGWDRIDPYGDGTNNILWNQ